MNFNRRIITYVLTQSLNLFLRTRNTYLLLLLTFFSITTLAQTNKTNEVQSGLYYGPSLGSGRAVGFTEVVNTWGLKINKGISEFRPEFFIHRGSSNADPDNNINLLIAGLTVKNAVTIKDLDYLRPIVLTGLQYVKYHSTNAGERTGEGFHLGFGLELDISKNFQLRNDFLFCNGPGRILIVSLGLQMSFGGNSSGNSSSSDVQAK